MQAASKQRMATALQNEGREEREEKRKNTDSEHHAARLTIRLPKEQMIPACKPTADKARLD
jgi:hypothetical protein